MATEKEVALAAKITQTAESAFVGLEAMMKGWPAEFQAIMWEAAADIAGRRAAAARSSLQR